MRSIYGQWDDKHLTFLQAHDIDASKMPAFLIEEGEKYREIIEHLQDARNFKDRKAYVLFEKEEYASHNNFLLWAAYPSFLTPMSDATDGLDYLRNAFEGVCTQCAMPLGEQTGLMHFQKEIKLPKKYLFGTHHGMPRVLITDRERFELINKHWNIGSKDILIGKKKKVSTNLVQLDIPVASESLNFGNSEFGKTFKPDGSGEIGDYTECTVCNRPLYTNQILDLFPGFENPQKYDFLFTNEWFGSFGRHLLISKRVAEYLVDKKFVKWQSINLVPVKIRKYK